MSTQLYGGDIYLLGGSHFLMKDLEKKQGAAGDASGKNDASSSAFHEQYSNRLKFSQASTTTGSEVPLKSGSLNR